MLKIHENAIDPTSPQLNYACHLLVLLLKVQWIDPLKMALLEWIRGLAEESMPPSSPPQILHYRFSHWPAALTGDGPPITSPKAAVRLQNVDCRRCVEWGLFFWFILLAAFPF